MDDTQKKRYLEMVDIRSGELVRDEAATKLDNGKPELAIVPEEMLALAARAFSYGAKKYARNNYKKGMSWTRLLDASLRHIYAFSHGEDTDPESGESHIAHALASLGMLAYHLKHHKDKDNR